MHTIIECDEQIRQLENIIRTATMYGDDVSYYENELSKMKNKRIELEEEFRCQMTSRSEKK
ncbi:hypothetical protein [Heyndrickxia sporothermodurans]|uniref:hypothetical protein n=1 Tax=Heyndrickxia sporothermodurans TaxID=46224 RepID=UPI0010573711|nr:hypothetical protein [Heyndrickxia sporothermodurans]